MFHHSSVTGRRPRKLDFMAGSERMIKAHHKNAVFHKTLEDKKTAFDEDCHKRLSKVQHEIYDVYFNEYVPLKEEANRIQQRLPNIRTGDFLPRLKKLATIQGPNGKMGTRFPEVHSLCLVSAAYKDSEEEKSKRTDSFLDLLRQRENERSINKKKKDKKTADHNLATPSSFWPDSDSDDSLPIDENRIKILKTAIALTSQPAVSPEPRKPRRLRRSFLVSLRRQSKVVWEEDLLKRISVSQPKERKMLTEIGEMKNSAVSKTQSEEIIEDVLPWRPSVSKNRILNDSEESDDEHNLALQSHQYRKSFERRISRSRASIESTLSDTMSIRKKSHSKLFDPPVHDMEDLYGSESSPDIFSVISEATGSFSSDTGSYTTGSYDDDSDSYYHSSDET